MFSLACTGGIGSGKSFVARIFSALGFPVYYADEKTKKLYDIDKNLLEKLRVLLGDDIVKDGVLQKREMAIKIFSNERLLKEVNKIVHPEVLKDYESWLIKRESEGYELALIESAIILSSEFFKDKVDAILVVDAPESVRIKRVMKRDGIDQQAVMNRIKRQMDCKTMLEYADMVIVADGERAVLPQVLGVLEKINIKIKY